MGAMDIGALQLPTGVQYFDMLRDVGSTSKASTVFIPHQPGSIGDIGGQIRNGFLQVMPLLEIRSYLPFHVLYLLSRCSVRGLVPSLAICSPYSV
jgi:hypothetical protein